ncbi:cyclase family protein [Mycobacterium paraense]|nr:cyclase family protein [Mycobacterium paraense]
MLLDLTLAIDMNDPIIGKASTDQNSFMSNGHIGTHLDTYLQTPIPSEFHHRRGVVVDATSYVESDSEIEVAVLRGRLIRPGDFVIFYTGAVEQAGYGTKAYFTDHPQLSWELINLLVQKKVSFIGLDAAGVRRPGEHRVADQMAEEHGTYIIENINNVGELLRIAGNEDFTIFTGWTGFRGYSGLQCRVIADLQELQATV